jgi:crotonobetainyl-CoA:carnitine CoA-transferase CaiB-like acyl-CoA transferase
MKKEEFYQDAIPTSIGPLEGIKVLEATTSGAGPWVGNVLADLGSEVIKIDQPGWGDLSRHIPPFIPGRQEIEAATGYLSIHRNKKGITLAMNKPEGQEVFRDLASKTDVIIENFKPGTMEKWGLGYTETKKTKPDIIYTSVSGFGQYGPYHTRPGYDPVGQAMGGLMYITGEADGPPLRTGNAMADNITGWLGALATLAAIIYRNRTGKGQHVDVNLLDTILYASGKGIIAAANANYIWQRSGSRYPGAVPCDTYLCKDGYVFIVAGLESHWQRLCQVMGREDLLTDQRLQTIAGRSEHAELVDQAIKGWVIEQTVADVVEKLEKAQLVVTPILNYKQILENIHILEREMVVEVDHPVVGPIKIYGIGPKLSLTPGKIRSAAPLMGQHNPEVYQGFLCYSREKLAQLKEKGII